jgi:PIN domain nuclease of toxin-antitoxin system
VTTGYLPDTNIALLGLIQPSRLSKRVLAAIDEGPNVVSFVTYGEVVLKSMKGQLAVGDLPAWWTEMRDQPNASALSPRPDHIARLQDLPPIHHNPFDRVLLPAEVCGRHDSSHSLRQ